MNRPTGIYRLKLSLDDTDSVVDASRISPSDVSARSAAVRYNRGTPYLYWLSNPLGHEHGSCATIQTAKLPLSAEYSARVLVGPVYDPYDNATIEQDPFPGIYLRDGDTISNKLSDPDEEEAGLLINSQWRSLLKILSISADTGNVRILSDDSEKSSGEAMNSPDTTPQALSLLATDGHKHIVVVRSSSTSYPELLFGTISGSASGDRVGVKWRLLKAWKPTFHSGATQAQDLRATIISIPEFEQTEAIFVTPSLSMYVSILIQRYNVLKTLMAVDRLARLHSSYIHTEGQTQHTPMHIRRMYTLCKYSVRVGIRFRTDTIHQSCSWIFRSFGQLCGQHRIWSKAD